MASTSVMISAGIADIGCTFVLIYFAWLGDRIFAPLLKWYYSIVYVTPPAIDPGIITWIFPLYYATILGCWFALQFALYFVVVSRSTNLYEVQ